MEGGDPMAEMKLDVNDAAEFAEMPRFLSQRLARDPTRLGASLAEFAGHPTYGIAQLHAFSIPRTDRVFRYSGAYPIAERDIG